jgi:predicted metal-dependent hydrolase
MMIRFKKTGYAKKLETMEFEGIPFEVIRRRVKYSRVEFKSPGEKLRVIVPWGIDPLKVLEDNKASILRKYRQLLDQIDAARKTPVMDWTEEDFKAMISRSVERYCQLLKVNIPRIKYRKMKRRWGSCRSDGIITLNTYLRYVPGHLIAYIVYHELAHLLIRGHSRKFKAIIAREFPNYRELDKELNLYGLKLLS